MPVFIYGQTGGKTFYIPASSFSYSNTKITVKFDISKITLPDYYVAAVNVLAIGDRSTNDNLVISGGMGWGYYHDSLNDMRMRRGPVGGGVGMYVGDGTNSSGTGSITSVDLIEEGSEITATFNYGYNYGGAGAFDPNNCSAILAIYSRFSGGILT